MSYWRILLLALIAALAIALAQPEVNWVLSYEEGLIRAKAEGKPVYLYFTKPDCPPCMMMEREAFRDPEVVSLLNEKFVPIKINVLERADLAAKYGVPGTPTHVFLWPNGTPIKGLLGYRDAESFKKVLKSVLEEVSSAKHPSEKHEAKRTATTYIPPLLLPAVLAFAAGAASALSPCVIPMIPVLIAGRGAISRGRGKALMALGLILTYTGLGALAGLAGGTLGQVRVALEKAAYVLFIVMGVTLLSDRLSAMLAILSSKFSSLGSRAAKGGGFLLGVILSFLWSPCIGPLVIPVLMGAAMAGKTVSGSLLMLSYSLGFSISLLSVFSLLEEVAKRTSRRMRSGGAVVRKASMLARKGRLLERAAGVFLVVLGLVYLLGWGAAIESLLLRGLAGP